MIPVDKYIIATTQRVIDEVRDYENREALHLGLELRRIMVLEPGEEYRRRTLREARRLGLRNKLSMTDIDVAALALTLMSNGEVLVITDDYALQELLLRLGVSFKPLRTRGIREGWKPPGSHENREA